MLRDNPEKCSSHHALWQKADIMYMFVFDNLFAIMFSNNALLFIFILPSQNVMKHLDALQMIAWRVVEGNI